MPENENAKKESAKKEKSKKESSMSMTIHMCDQRHPIYITKFVKIY